MEGKMRYMLLMYGAESDLSDEERTACMNESLGLCDELAARGKYLAASPLEPVATAATVRVRDGQVLITDGPFAETTEQLGGYFLLDLEHLDEAIAVATKLPPVRKGTVEIRPIFPLEGVPPTRSLPTVVGGESGDLFMLLCYDDEGAWRRVGPEALTDAMAEARELARELNDSGRYVSAAPLHSSEMATCVRVRNGKRAITDGPFAETNEVLGGYYVIRAESRDQALRIAARHPGARYGAVEVRPIFDLSGLEKNRQDFASPVDSRVGHSTR
jgi:hypothetical protein